MDVQKLLEEFKAGMNANEAFIEATKDMSEPSIHATLCLLIESFCKKRGYNVVEYIEEMAKEMKCVNKTFGEIKLPDEEDDEDSEDEVYEG